MSTLKQQYPLLIGENDPILRAVSQPVGIIDKDIKHFARNLLTLMHVYHGVGLAAPQIGHNIRIIAVSQRKTDKKNTIIGKCIAEHVMINPTIVSHSEDMNTDIEGCLSLPGLQGKVQRYNDIVVSYKDLHNQSRSLHLQGLNARIVQHEIDHLDGILYIDKLVGPLIHKSSHIH